jgi:peptidoglycan hydrolase CwlO-like protein
MGIADWFSSATIKAIYSYSVDTRVRVIDIQQKEVKIMAAIDDLISVAGKISSDVQAIKGVVASIQEQLASVQAQLANAQAPIDALNAQIAQTVQSLTGSASVLEGITNPNP